MMKFINIIINFWSLSKMFNFSEERVGSLQFTNSFQSYSFTKRTALFVYVETFSLDFAGSGCFANDWSESEVFSTDN